MKPLILTTTLELLTTIVSVQSDETAAILSSDLVTKSENLLEGFRPRRILRLLASNWPLDDLPWEEMLWPADNRVR